MNKLNVFQYSLYKKPLHEWIFWFFRRLKYSWQRITKGFCDEDTWDLDKYYTQFFIETLTYFKNNLHSAPGDFSNELDENFQKWEDYLSEMITHFYNSVEENEVKKNEFSKDYFLFDIIINDIGMKKELSKKFLEREMEIAAWRRQELNKGLDMLKERFDSLWD